MNVWLMENLKLYDFKTFSATQLKSDTRVYRNIPRKEWDLEGISNTLHWHKNMENINHSEGAKNIDFTYYLQIWFMINVPKNLSIQNFIEIGEE